MTAWVGRVLAALVLTAACVAVPGASSAQQPPWCSGLVAYAFETVTVSSTAIGFTASLFSNVKAAQIAVKTANIVYRVDGGAPTASVGYPVVAGKSVLVCGENNVRNFLAIRSTVTAAMDVTLFR